MILLLAVLLLAAAGALALRRWRGSPVAGPAGALLAAAVALAPLALALVILVPSRGRLDDLHIR